MSCPDENTWVSFVDGGLSPDERDAIEAHLDVCPACRALLVGFARNFPGSASAAPSEAEAEAGSEPPSANHVIAAGEQLGRYVLLQPLGEGAMGAVWAAHDPQLGRDVAIKLLRTDPVEPVEVARARLAREARAMAKVEHPNVLAIYDVLREGDEQLVVMEWVKGPNLRAWLSEAPRARREILAVFLQAGRGLDAAHAAGLVHRDFKAENVLLGPDGVARVCDFGLARNAVSLMASRTTGSRPGSRITQAGAVVGTPAYMAPELWTNPHVDARVDQYAFCASLTEALCGDDAIEPAEDPTVQATNLRAALREAKLPGWMERPLLRGLQSEPEDRFPSMSSLLEQLARKATPSKRAWVLGALAGLCVAGGLGLFAWHRRSGSGARCRVAARRVDEVWNASSRASLSPELRGALEDHFEEWKRAACAPGPSPDAVCLVWSFARAEALVRVLSTADATELSHAGSAVAALPAASSCARARPVPQSVPPTTRPEASSGSPEVDLRLRRTLARAAALSAVGHPEEALPLADRALDEARRSGRALLQARALFVLAQTQSTLTPDNPTLAARTAQQAAWVSRTTGAEGLKTRIAAFRRALNPARTQALPAKERAAH